MTYYGRWTYKFEEAARQGATAALIIHDDEAAAYGWDVVKNSWTGEQSDLPREGRSGAARAKRKAGSPLDQRDRAVHGRRPRHRQAARRRQQARLQARADDRPKASLDLKQTIASRRRRAT